MSNYLDRNTTFSAKSTYSHASIFRLMLCVLFLGVGTGGQAYDERAIQNQTELEIAALTAILEHERVVRRYHRAIVNYREVLGKIERKRAKQKDDRPISIGNVAPLFHMSKLMKRRTPHERRLIARIIQGDIDLDFVMATPSEQELYMEEMVVIGNSFERIPLDPAEFSVAEIKQMRGSRSHANELYADGYYDDAYPLLLELAKRGFKDSQSRLAYILFNGTENVKKSNLRALGWLASAAYGDSEPKFRVLFNRYMKEVPESVRPTVDEVITRYQQTFAFDEHQNCSTEHPFAYGVVKRTYCRFDLETIADACVGYQCWADRVNVESP